MISLILLDGSKKLFSDTIPYPAIPLTLKVAVRMTVQRARDAEKISGKIESLVPLIINGGVQDSTAETIVPDGVYVCVIIGRSKPAQVQDQPVSFWLD